MLILAILVSSYLLLSFVLFAYVAVMHLKKVWPEVTTPTKIIIAPALFVGLAAYALLNITVGTLLFLQIPESLQFTHRCERNLYKYRNNRQHWRYRQALWWCRILDIFDKGHCKHESV